MLNKLTRTQITDHDAILDFVFAGKATFTLVSKATGARFTYRVCRANGEDHGRPWFVKVLTGSDNESCYSYAGVVFPQDRGTFRTTAKSKIKADAPSARGIAWFLGRLNAHLSLDQVEFWHEGLCGACGRTLTVPESIARGLGPICAGKTR